MEGTIKWFDQTKRFGFIQPADGGSDVFVHISAVDTDSVDRLKDGVKVEFETTEGAKGLQANDVKVVE